MAEPTEPPDNKEPPQPADRPEFISPYKVFPTEDAAREAVVAAAADGRDQPEQQAAVFDPTKPTIDQTRANAILAIQQNFEALTPVAGVVPAQYLKKTGDTAVNLHITPGNLVVDGGSSIQIIGVTGTIAAGAPAKILEVSSATAADASYMAFRRTGTWNAFFGIDTDNQWKVGGSSYGAVSYKLLHEGNSFTISGGGLTTALAITTTSGILANRIKQTAANLGAVSGTVNVLPVSGFTSYLMQLAGNVTIAIEGGMTVGNILRLTIIATNMGTVTWPGTVIWPMPGQTPPDLAAGAAKRAVVVLTWDSGYYLANAAVY